MALDLQPADDSTTLDLQPVELTPAEQHQQRVRDFRERYKNDPQFRALPIEEQRKYLFPAEEPAPEPGYLQRVGTNLVDRAKQAGRSAGHTVEEMGRSLLPPPLRDKFEPKASAGEMIDTVGNVLFPGMTAATHVGGALGKATGLPGAETTGEFIGGATGGFTSPLVRNAAKGAGSAVKRYFAKPDIEEAVGNFAEKQLGTARTVGGRQAARDATKAMY